MRTTIVLSVALFCSCFMREVPGAVLRANAKKMEEEKLLRANAKKMEEEKLLDMPKPLAEFSSVLGDSVKDMTCDSWAQIYGLDVLHAGCGAAAIMKSHHCDEGCKSAFANDPTFMSKRCPETCARGEADGKAAMLKVDHWLTDTGSEATSKAALLDKSARMKQAWKVALAQVGDD